MTNEDEMDPDLLALECHSECKVEKLEITVGQHDLRQKRKLEEENVLKDGKKKITQQEQTQLMRNCLKVMLIFAQTGCGTFMMTSLSITCG
jgi:hypothetical protein